MAEHRDSLTSFESHQRWVRKNMPLTATQAEAFPSLSGIRLACSIHLDPKIAPGISALMKKGAAIFITTCNPTTVRDEVVAWLVREGAEAHAWKDMSGTDFIEAARQAIAWRPTHVWEMGATLVSEIVDSGARPPLRAGMECTGSGIARLKRLAAEGRLPPAPLFNGDEVPIKEGLHNRYLVGQSAWQAFTERTELSLHRKNVLVIGYGLVGQGVALTARALGGTVSVAERDPARALFARYEGLPIVTLEAGLGAADVIVTATGAHRVLAAGHFPLLKEGCILMNVGHAPDEIEVDALGALSEVLPFVSEARVAGRTVYLFAGGSMANLTAGQGDTLNSFDITMAAMLAGLRYVLSPEAAAAPPGLHPLPRSAWEEVARKAAE